MTIDEIKSALAKATPCLVPKPGHGGISCHERLSSWWCYCDIAFLLAELEAAKLKLSLMELTGIREIPSAQALLDRAEAAEKRLKEYEKQIMKCVECGSEDCYVK